MSDRERLMRDPSDKSDSPRWIPVAPDRQAEVLNKHHCAKCGGAISGEYGTEAYWKAGPNDEPLCSACGDAVVKAALDHERAVIEYEREQTTLRAKAEALDGLREVLEQGNWCRDGGGFTMGDGFWIEDTTFAALFPDWPASLPCVSEPFADQVQP